MFGQLTSGLESAWNKLKGAGYPFTNLYICLSVFVYIQTSFLLIYMLRTGDL